MKKIILSLGVFFGLFLIAGSTSAAYTAEQLQPASDIEYSETLIVPSIKIGKQGVGGVTFFNGTIVNSTTDESGDDNPVTFGDNVRIDGEIFRTQKGSDPLKISDSIIPTASLINNLGSDNNRWSVVYSANGDFTGNLGVQGIVDINGGMDVEGTSTIGNLSSDGWINTTGPIVTSANLEVGEGLNVVGGTIYSSEDDYVEFGNPIKPGYIKTCNNSNLGIVRYDSANDRFQGCTQSGWRVL